MQQPSRSRERISVITLVELWVAGVSLGLATLLIIVAVAMRYFFGYSPPHFEELTRYFVIWSVFIGASHLLHRSGHVSIDVLLVNLPLRWRFGVQGAAFVVGAFYCSLIAYFGVQMVIQSYELGARSISSLRAPMWIPQLAIPLGATLMLVRFVEKIIAHAKLLRAGGE